MYRLFAVLALGVRIVQALPITCYGHIAPIVYHAWTPCHRPGEPGPLPLLTYNHVQKHGWQIVSVIKRRDMRPWLPKEGYGDFQEERRLTDEQIRTIEEWVLLRGAPAGAPPLPKFVPGWQLGEPDLVLRLWGDESAKPGSLEEAAAHLGAVLARLARIRQAARARLAQAER